MEVQPDWRKLRNEELHDLYLWLVMVQVAKSRRMRWAGHVTCMGDERNAYVVLVGKAEVEKPLGRPRLRWKEDIKMYVKTQDESSLTGLVLLGRDKCKRGCVPFESHKMPGNFFVSCVTKRCKEVQDS
jgi:hypothetical protein